MPMMYNLAHIFNDSLNEMSLLGISIIKKENYNELNMLCRYNFGRGKQYSALDGWVLVMSDYYGILRQMLENMIIQIH